MISTILSILKFIPKKIYAAYRWMCADDIEDDEYLVDDEDQTWW